MSTNYYCLVAGLPDILIEDNKLSTTLADFKSYLKESLEGKDYQLIESFFWRYDNDNILKSLQGNEYPFNKMANLTLEETEEVIALAKDDALHEFNRNVPPYFQVLINAFVNEEEIYPGKSWELKFSQAYYQHVTSVKNLFIKDWYYIERDLTNLLTAFMTKKHKLETETQLIGDNEVTHLLVKNNSRDFGLSNDFPQLEELLKALEENDLQIREKRIDQLKWNLLDEQVFFHYFSIERIFSFVLKLSWVERWVQLDKETGAAMFKELLNELGNTYKIPQEF